MHKPPFHLLWPQRFYEFVQRNDRISLISSLGIMIWALFSPGPSVPTLVANVPSTTSTPPLVATNTPLPLTATESMATTTDMPTSTSSPTRAMLPTSTPTDSAPYYITDPVISQWPLILSDTFDTNGKDWPTGDFDDAPVTGNTSITDGKYRWDWKAKQGANYRAWPDVEPITDFNLTVDARRVEGDPGAYGLIFRETDDSGFYYFSISDASQEFIVLLLSNGGWTRLIDYTRSSNIRAGDVNQMGVTANGSLFRFYINNRYVGEVHDDKLIEGKVGVAADLFSAGDEAVFEFDNFELRIPAQPSEPIDQTPTSAPSPSLTPPPRPTQPPPTQPPPTNPPPPAEPTSTPAPPAATQTPAPP